MTRKSTKITVTKETFEHELGGPAYSINFRGELMTASDQQRLSECLTEDLLRQIADLKEKLAVALSPVSGAGASETPDLDEY